MQRAIPIELHQLSQGRPFAVLFCIDDQDVPLELQPLLLAQQRAKVDRVLLIAPLSNEVISGFVYDLIDVQNFPISHCRETVRRYMPPWPFLDGHYLDGH